MTAVVRMMKADAAATDKERAARSVATVWPAMAAARYVRADRQPVHRDEDTAQRDGDGRQAREGADPRAGEGATVSPEATANPCESTEGGTKQMSTTLAIEPTGKTARDTCSTPTVMTAAKTAAAGATSTEAALVMKLGATKATDGPLDDDASDVPTTSMGESNVGEEDMPLSDGGSDVRATTGKEKPQ